MTFQPGISGNPSGRAHIPPEIKELARKHTKRAILRLAHIMENSENDGACVMAAKEILDRGWGKPAQEITGKDGGPIELAAFLTDARARRQAALEGPLIEAIAQVVAEDATPDVSSSQASENNGLAPENPPISELMAGARLRKKSKDG